MKNAGIKLSLYINYFVFAILLNSVGIVILKSQKVYGVDEIAASTLELFKDMPIAIVSFLIASFLPRIGYKKAMLAALAIVTFATMGMYFGNSFWAAKMLFAAVGTAFALIKVSVYSAIGLVTNNEKEHNSLMSSIEGVFMFGIALAYFLFPAFNSETDQNAWLNVYWVLSGLSLMSFLFLLNAKFDEGEEIPGANLADDFIQMLKLLLKLLVIVFVIAAFLFVMIEQGIMTWYPTFNERILNFSETLSEATKENISIQLTSIFVISLGIGRIVGGYLTKRFSWISVLIVFILLAMCMIQFVLPSLASGGGKEILNFTNIPISAYAFPVIGFFIGPIYPLINSVILSALPKKLHSPMTGLIIVFSAIGGTLGSRSIGYLFKTVGADTAFSYTLIPMIVLLICLVILRRLTNKTVVTE